METQFDNEFEKGIRDFFDDATIAPSNRVWNNLEKELKEKRKKRIFWWFLNSFVVAGIISSAAIYHFYGTPNIDLTKNKGLNTGVTKKNNVLNENSNNFKTENLVVENKTLHDNGLKNTHDIKKEINEEMVKDKKIKFHNSNKSEEQNRVKKNKENIVSVLPTNRALKGVKNYNNEITDVDFKSQTPKSKTDVSASNLGKPKKTKSAFLAHLTNQNRETRDAIIFEKRNLIYNDSLQIFASINNMLINNSYKEDRMVDLELFDSSPNYFKPQKYWMSFSSGLEINSVLKKNPQGRYNSDGSPIKRELIEELYSAPTSRTLGANFSLKFGYDFTDKIAFVSGIAYNRKKEILLTNSLNYITSFQSYLYQSFGPEIWNYTDGSVLQDNLELDNGIFAESDLKQYEGSYSKDTIAFDGVFDYNKVHYSYSTNIEKASGSIVSKYQFIEVPLYFQYKILDKKFSLLVGMGLSASWLQRVVSINNYNDHEQNKQTRFENRLKQETYNSITISSLVVITGEYKLNSSLALNVSPTFKYGFNSFIKKDLPIQKHFYSYGLELGIKKYF